MEEKLKSEILHIEDLLSDLREEFKRADINNSHELSKDQLGQALLNLGSELRPQELDALFKSIDRNNNGAVDIDEFIGFIMSPADRDSFDADTDAAVYNIRKLNKVSPLETFKSFMGMPNNYCFSFIREQLKKEKILPSATLKPQLDPSGLVFTDLTPTREAVDNFDPKKAKKKSSLPISIKPYPSNLAVRIRLKRGEGIPIPIEPNEMRQRTLIGRELRVCLFDPSQREFLGNTCVVEAEWKRTYEGKKQS